MMRGLPASGKTSTAKELMKEWGNFVRVNKDELRPMLHGDAKWSGKKEKLTKKAQRVIVMDFLRGDQSVIVDDTNLRPADEENWKRLAQECKATFEVKDMDTPFEECISRDLERENGVGPHVILSMALSSGRYPYSNIVLCDIDGTVANIDHRLHYVKDGNKDWDSFFSEVKHDTFRQDIWEQVKATAYDNSAQVVFLSGRSDVCREDTEDWLEWHIGELPFVLMRREFDRRPDTEVKEDMFNWHFKDYNIVKVFDDRPRLVKMWRDKGLEVVDCGNGVDF